MLHQKLLLKGAYNAKQNKTAIEKPYSQRNTNAQEEISHSCFLHGVIDKNMDLIK